MKVAIVHYWLVGMRGGEKVVEALCNLYPGADIFTHVYAPQSMSPVINAHRVQTSFIDRLPFSATKYKSYLPLMPMALEQLDLRGYDLIISSESGPAKGIIPPSDAIHICYCHSPMRYVWNMYHDYRERTGLFTRLLMPPAAHYVRNWDAISAGRVHEFIANSATVARRIETYYRRQAAVIHPPVDTSAFETVPESEIGDYHLMVGELVRYKRPELAIQAFNRLQKPLIVIGGGEMLRELQGMAGPHVKLLGPQPFDVLKYHYARCQALIFPGEEDFGIVPVEAMASGRPVIAYGKGGVTETVIDGVTGTFFHEQSVDALIDAIHRCKAIALDPGRIARRASEFNVGRFSDEIERFVDTVLKRRGGVSSRSHREQSRAYLVQ
ncbi:glycosyltransferase [Methylobacterium sp. CM6257]